jgi:septal ring-binding cell division protein DamX
MHMMIKLFIAVLGLLASGTAAAEIQAATSCYVGDSRPNSKVHLYLAVRTYTDTETQKEIGAFAQYDRAKLSIPLVFIQYVATDTDSPGLGNYELTRVEVVNKKVTGEYVFIQTGAGNRQGRLVRYKSAKFPTPIVL